MANTTTIAYGKGESVRTLTVAANEVSIGYTKVHNGVEYFLQGWGVETGIAGLRNHPDRERVTKVSSVEEVREMACKFKANALKAGLNYLGRIDG